MKSSAGDLGLAEATLPSIYVAAHELKAPLVLMRQLSLELQRASGENSSITVERLLLSVERSLRLVDQLTRTSRLDEALFESEPVLASVVCRAVAYELEPFASQHGQKIVTRVSRRSQLAVGQQSLLIALLVNLCDNALAHNPKGGKVVISAVNRKDGILFSVRDHGPAMSHRAFEGLKSQLGKGPLPTGDRPRSSGLGLWIASQFANVMGSNLSMIRHHESGISVSVLLPQSKQLTLL